MNSPIFPIFTRHSNTEQDEPKHFLTRSNSFFLILVKNNRLIVRAYQNGVRSNSFFLILVKNKLILPKKNYDVMVDALTNYRKATTLAEVDNAVRFDVPISADHPLFVDFSDVRGDFEDKVLYKSLNVDPRTFKYNRTQNTVNKTLVFLTPIQFLSNFNGANPVALEY
jgi:hypothetical protein